jgi:hypothetical protein
MTMTFAHRYAVGGLPRPAIEELPDGFEDRGQLGKLAWSNR